jgi:hypothetical protein
MWVLIWAHLKEWKKRKKIKYFLLTLYCYFIFSGAYPQDHPESYDIIFYNVENLFDVHDDPETSDDEFTPEGSRRWTAGRFNRKLINISKAVLNSSGWNPPQIIALCETENRYVLERLLSFSPLGNFNYNIIHKDSPDNRGIDVVFLYDPGIFDPLEFSYIPLVDKEGEIIHTREIMYVSGVFDRTDTVHFFINHWPSRYSGLLKSRGLRILAAETLREKLERLWSEYTDPQIIIMGDFNDQPGDISITGHLKALPDLEYYSAGNIYNLSADWTDGDIGTTKYRSQWYVFDQIMVSGNLLDKQSGLYTERESARIVDLPFLLEPDERYGGVKPLRTYYGYTYTGGFSDHLPVIIQLRSVP